MTPLHPLESALLTHCRKKKLFRKDDRVLLAVSGGMDSMVLLYLLAALREKLGIQLAVAHIHHGLRGRQSDADARFVQQAAKTLGLKYHFTRVDVAKRARRHGESIEQAGRTLRYTFLERIARNHRYTCVCTAHQADDQSETVLARIIKGAGWKGLSGVREIRDGYVRPLLPFRRSELERYAADCRIRHREDPTNRDTRFFRNKIRHTLLPLLRTEFDPRIDRHLGQLARIASDTHRSQRTHAERLFTRVCRQRQGKIVLDIKPLRRYLFDQKQALYELIFDKFFTGRIATFGDYERLDELVDDAQSGRRLIVGTVECLRLTQSVEFRTFRRLSQRSFRFSIKGAGTYEWPEYGFSLELRPVAWNRSLRPQFGRSRDVEFVDARIVQGEWIIRSWRPGDSFFPLGMRHPKKLSDFFSDEKVPLTIRKSIPLVCVRSGRKEQIVWVCGHRIDDRCKATETTTNVWRLEYTREGSEERTAD